MAYKEHLKEGPRQVGCAVITVSDTRDESSDKSGQLIRDLLEAQGHQIVYYAVVEDVPMQIKGELAIQVQRSSCQAIILNGGTGIAPRDHTYDTVAPLLDKRLDGFGELFRLLSYQEIGSGAMLSRAVAGTYKGRVLFSLPGSTGAVRLAMEKLILPELGHMVGQLNRHS
ncbi:MAG: molybdenum cofactor biosynthesis protein MoaB [Candidatus Latescibacteria bacterium]|nr:molybdenum cofactor biosynthesis protein MoaB [Candidatus Latescibacterota bacterium]